MTEITGRNYAADMDKAIADAIPEGDYAAGVVAQDLVNRLREEDPDLLFGFVMMHATKTVTDLIARRSNATRQLLRINAPRARFRKAAETFEQTGDATELSVFKVEFVVDDQDTRRRVGDLTAQDCNYVASCYEATAKRAAMEAAFHRAIGKKVGLGRVRDVMDEDTYLRLYKSITGKNNLPQAV